MPACTAQSSQKRTGARRTSPANMPATRRVALRLRQSAASNTAIAIQRLTPSVCPLRGPKNTVRWNSIKPRNSFSGVNGDLADFLGGSATLASGRSRNDQLFQWFNTASFTANRIGTTGNSGRNIIRGPKFFNADAGLLKDTAITERFQLQFRAEFFNMFNNPNFRLPNNNAASAQFGRVTAVVDDNQRIVQLGMKLSF